MDDAFGHWLAGFTDGEGYFGIAQVKARGANGGKSWPNVRFEIGLRADDAAVLRMIRDTLGVGRINVLAAPGATRPNSQGALRYNVHRLAELPVIVDLFTRYPLRAKKRAQFEVWCEAVREMAKGRGRSDAVIDDCRARLAALRVFVPPENVAELLSGNPAPAIRRHDKGEAPACLCGCGGMTRLLSHTDSVAHPDNPHFNSFLRGHNRRMMRKL